MGEFQQAVRKAHTVDDRLKNLVALKGAQMIGCEFCVDLGSQICRNSGFSEEELLALPRYRQSDLFTEREKLAIDYTVAVMRTPVDVTDELFARIKEHFTDAQLVEITALLTVVNLDRFNAAFGIGAAGFSDGIVCALVHAAQNNVRRPSRGCLSTTPTRTPVPIKAAARSTSPPPSERSNASG